jgi:hypothetical protein
MLGIDARIANGMMIKEQKARDAKRQRQPNGNHHEEPEQPF